jgi:hypothetical protein
MEKTRAEAPPTQAEGESAEDFEKRNEAWTRRQMGPQTDAPAAEQPAAGAGVGDQNDKTDAGPVTEKAEAEAATDSANAETATQQVATEGATE